MRNALWIATAAALVALLSACQVSTSVPIADQIDDTVTARTTTEANLSAETPVTGNISLAPGEDRLYRVDVPSSGEPALYAYLDNSLDLYVYRGSGSLYATSRSSLFFASGSGGLGPAAATAGVEPQQVGVAQDCPGSCVIMPNPGSGRVYVRVRNQTDTTESFTLWAVLRSFEDANEAAFGPGDPAPIAGNDFESGAIETLGDQDYFEVQDSGTLYLDLAEGSVLDVVAEISDPIGGNPTRTVRPGGEVQVSIGEEIRVYADDSPDRAAVSANSQYFLELLPN